MPSYTSLMIHLSHWQLRLIVRIELEIDAVVRKLFEHWQQIEKALNSLNFMIAELESPKTTSSCHRNFQHLLLYVMMEIEKWWDMQNLHHTSVTAFIKPNIDMEKAISRCKQSLQAVVNKLPKNS
uniref:Uncharacterized protein n=1 Tax=Setaria digitata TaxID=48799 RepID=A0A915Q7S4_9BILA